jgi:transposase
MALPTHLPVVETVIEPEEDTTGMVCIGREITDELDYTPAKLHINRIIRPKYMAREDEKGNQKQVIAELNRPIPKCIASAALLSMIFTDKYVYHLPLYRIHRRINQMDVQLPSSTLESWIKLGADLIRPLYAVHRLYVFSEIYQMIDESPIKVLDRDKPGACYQGYMWVRYGSLSKSVLFEYYKSRSAKGPIDDLSTFKGYIQTDGYSGYTYLASLQGLTHLSCWVHALLRQSTFKRSRKSRTFNETDSIALCRRGHCPGCRNVAPGPTSPATRKVIAHHQRDRTIHLSTKKSGNTAKPHR